MEAYLSTLFGLKGKTALVTGGTRGIGRALTVALASAGCDIVLLVRSPNSPENQSIASEIASIGQKCRTYEWDLDVLSEAPLIITQLCRAHEFDIFVHCAGLQHRAPAEDFPDAAWDNVIGVNLTAGFKISRELAKHWLNTSLKTPMTPESVAGKKRIIFIASMTTFTGSIEIPAYTASKGAIGQLTKALNNEWMAKGINVNAIAPGYIETELTAAIKDGSEKEAKILDRIPAGRWGLPADLAGSVIHLCSRSGDYIGGEVHAVDGGYLGR
ncbi:2-dehydro-3-deoxy-D-gluconate 5-dehydrogenase [Lachnellula suecica]|uniref:2-dehydro-3-deoxy-D-gluconate 5-dehydrogenase n=1 Tax=Lachnellula suecica TaxID=602035 RepID=A0A8T9BZ84_9HELO|nr:2-dehydro-3-deoxy-D-gluconate 5-dehydrogenase [Lachnellula suecica]